MYTSYHVIMARDHDNCIVLVSLSLVTTNCYRDSELCLTMMAYLQPIQKNIARINILSFTDILYKNM